MGLNYGVCLMIGKREKTYLLAMFIVGSVLGYLFLDSYRTRMNQPEVMAQRLIDDNYDSDLCMRVRHDLEEFRTTPLTFQRVSYSKIEQETKAAIRYLLKADGVPEDFPISYTGGALSCEKDLAKWLQIPSAGSQLLEDENVQAGLGQVAKKNANELPSLTTGNKKVALIIGNAEYKNRPLKNPTHDADDISKFLSSNGFTVINLRNADLQTMNSGISKFSEDLKSNSVGLVYYSGHGIEYNGRNYLIPVNTSINDEDDIPRQTVDASTLVEKVGRSDKKVNIFIIDACRNNFVQAKSKSARLGLGKMEGSSGTLVAFSTAPGKVAEDGNGKNSPYAKHFLKAASVPGKKIEEVFKDTARGVEVETNGRQIPWYNSSLMVDYSFK